MSNLEPRNLIGSAELPRPGEFTKKHFQAKRSHSSFQEENANNPC